IQLAAIVSCSLDLTKLDLTKLENNALTEALPDTLDYLFGQYIEKFGLVDMSLVTASPQSLLKRAGFKYELYRVTTKDGYVLQMVRIINPLIVDRKSMRRLPVLFQCPFTASSSLFLVASLDDTRPQAYPPQSPPSGNSSTLFDNDAILNEVDLDKWAHHKSSSNRSLALMLANQGF
ncbi:hypothetical protein GZH46_00739, partial [Fragariocoptes setiger]